MSPNQNNNAAFIAGIAAVATGIWTIFNNSNNSSKDDNQKEIEASFNQAVLLTQQGNYDGAIQIFFEILQTNPNHAPTYNYLAWIYAIHNYELDQALAFANKAVQLASNDLDKACFIDTLGEVYAHRQEFDTAIKLSRECLRIFQSINQHPSNSTTYFRLAWCYQIKQDFDSTYKVIQKILQFNNLNAWDYSAIGDIYNTIATNFLMKGIYQKAIENYNNAENKYIKSIQIASSKNNLNNIFLFKLSSNFSSKGVAFYYLEYYEHCKQAHQEAYKIYQENPYPPMNLAQLAAKHKNRQEMLYWLGITMPLVIDNPPFIQQGHLISTMLNEFDFDEYKDDVLGLLFNHGKINTLDYQRYLKIWVQKSNLKPQVAHFSQQNFYANANGIAQNVEGNFINHPQGI